MELTPEECRELLNLLHQVNVGGLPLDMLVTNENQNTVLAKLLVGAEEE
jgi:hypothetical protein